VIDLQEKGTYVKMRKCLIFSGGPSRAWTWDLQIMSLLLNISSWNR